MLQVDDIGCVICGYGLFACGNEGPGPSVLSDEVPCLGLAVLKYFGTPTLLLKGGDPIVFDGSLVLGLNFGVGAGHDHL